MKKILMFSLLVGFASCASFVFGGFSIAFENDVFLDKDNNYSHNTEIMYYDVFEEEGEFYRMGFGMHQSMYTPIDIQSTEMPPKNSRPWCGILSMVIDANYFSENLLNLKEYEREYVHARLEIGLMGKYSFSEQSQKKVHKLIDSKEPLGWDNQMPFEPVVNFYYERYSPVFIVGERCKWTLRDDLVYGGTLGTTFINTVFGNRVVFGYNIPMMASSMGIDPKGFEEEVINNLASFYSFAYLAVDGSSVAHNSTIGKSFFRNRDAGMERSLERFYGQLRVGSSIGWKNVGLDFQVGFRTDEFKEQKGTAMKWCLLRLGYGFYF